jgi:hypothetical protein
MRYDMAKVIVERPLAAAPACGGVLDVVLRREVTVPTERSALRIHHGRWVHAVAKRQLNKREIRRLSLLRADGVATDAAASVRMTWI